MRERILAIRLRALGDVVLTTPALRSLRRGHPGAALDVVTERAYAPLLESVPGIERVWPLDRTASSTLELIGRLRREGYTLAVDFFGNPRSAFITAWCGARHTAGYELRGRRLAYRTRVPRVAATAVGRAEYAAAAHVRLALAVGGVEDGLDARLTLAARAREEADRALARAGITDPHLTVGLVPAGTWATKTWPLSHFALLARRLLGAGRRLLAMCGPGEEDAASRLSRMAPGIATLPVCDVATLAALVARLGAVVGTDSGPRHLAAAFGVPTFTWFGPALPEIWTPPGEQHGYWFTALPCRGCNRTACPHWNCLPELSPTRAVELVLGHLDRHARSTAGLDTAARA